MGRRSKLTSEVTNAVVASLRLGASRLSAATAAGIGESTFYRWMERGETARQGVFREFWEAVRRAENQAELTALQHWNAALPTDWRACKEFLERRFPERWALRQVGAEAQAPLEVYVVREEQLSEQEWAQLAQSTLQGSPSEESS